jgi:hypothetical protein
VGRVELGQIYSGQSGFGTDLYRTMWHCDRFILDRVALGKIYRGQSVTVTFIVDRVSL